MVKRFVTILLSLVIVLLGVLPFSFAYDVVQTDADMFGFSWDNSNIIFTQNRVNGYQISTTGPIQPTKVYLYIPAEKPMESLTFMFSIVKGAGTFSFDSADYGSIYSNAYHITATLDSPTIALLGYNDVTGSSARITSYKASFYSFPFSTSVGGRYIRLTFDLASGTNVYTYLSRSVSTSSSGTVSADADHKLDINGTQRIVPGTASYSGTGTIGEHNITINSGNLKTQEVYITGALRSYYASGSYTNVILNSSANYPYLRIPSLAINCNSTNSLGGKIAQATSSDSGTINLGIMTGTNSLQAYNGSLASSDTGSFVDRTYVDTVTMSATRSYSDKDLIEAVNDASDRNHTDITNFSNRNHTDLTNISNQLQELVDHQEAVTQTGNDIGSTTSSSTISNTSGNLSTGVGGLNSTLSTASDVSSFVTASTPYINFVGAFLPVILNFGNGVLAWAVVAIIAVTVFLYILKKVSE